MGTGEKEQRKRRGRAPPKPPVTIGEMLDVFVEQKDRELRDRLVERSTFDWYRGLAVVLKARLGDVVLEDLSRRAHMLGWVKRRQKEQASARSIRGEAKVLRIALNMASRRGWWSGDARALFVHLLDDLEEEEIAWLEREEWHRFRSAIDDDLFRLAAEVLVDCGMRVGELRTRDWRDWSRGGKTLRVCNRPSYRFRTKGKKLRSVTLSPRVNELLAAEWERRGRPGPDEVIFPREDGTFHPEERWFNERTHAACAAAGIKDITAHCLRHTYATLSLESGVSIEVVSRQLGHHSVEFTRETYLHAGDRFRNAAAAQAQAYRDGGSVDAQPAEAAPLSRVEPPRGPFAPQAGSQQHPGDGPRAPQSSAPREPVQQLPVGQPVQQPVLQQVQREAPRRPAPKQPGTPLPQLPVASAAPALPEPSAGADPVPAWFGSHPNPQSLRPPAAPAQQQPAAPAPTLVVTVAPAQAAAAPAPIIKPCVVSPADLARGVPVELIRADPVPSAAPAPEPATRNLAETLRDVAVANLVTELIRSTRRK